MQYSKEVEEMCCVAKGPKHGPAPIPEEGKWAVSYTHLGVGAVGLADQHLIDRSALLVFVHPQAAGRVTPVSYTHLSTPCVLMEAAKTFSASGSKVCRG